ncbi:uncharacterized protein ACN63O_018130 [Diretmus argenteus]
MLFGRTSRFSSNSNLRCVNCGLQCVGGTVFNEYATALEFELPLIGLWDAHMLHSNSGDCKGGKSWVTEEKENGRWQQNDSHFITFVEAVTDLRDSPDLQGRFSRGRISPTFQSPGLTPAMPPFVLSFLLVLLLAGPAFLTPSTSQELEVRGERTTRDTKQDSIKVVISEGCVTHGGSSDSSQGGKEIDLAPGAPLVLTHTIKLVPSGSGSGSCGCETDFAALRERLERLEREVSTLREKCGGAEGGCCTSKESKGAACSIKPEVDECPNECSDQGRCVDGKCVCFPGFSGPDCSQSNCPGNCNDKGRCVNGQCVCDPGFSGPDCSQSNCPGNCNDKGRCVNGQCVCDPGFSGPDCSRRGCPDNCNNQGRCVNGRCVCKSGFTGPSCSDKSCPGNCNNKGRCVNGQCVCDHGFTGPDCSERSCPDNCNDRGRCVNGRCVCDSGFTGPDCSEISCPGNCNNQGRCINGQCTCDPGFTGPDCSERACPDNCNNRGRCVNGRCVCDSGFTGADCSEISCPGNCNNQGRCINGQCTCDPGFTGPDCSEKACPDNCNSRGRCVDGQCVCDTGFTGPDCSAKACPKNCSKRGRCVDGQCVCNTGFTGPDCSAKACPKNCSNRGKCVNGKCVCDVGSAGPDCSAKGCLSNCNNKGRCIKGRCVCRRGFKGPDCSECDAGLTGPNCDIIMSGVSQLSTRDVTETSVTLIWTPPPVQYQTYHIIFTSQKESDQQISVQVEGGLTSYTQTGLAAGQEYTVTVTGETDGRTGAETSNEFMTLTSGPTNLHVVKTTTTSAVVQWEQSQGEIDRYRLTVSPNDGVGRSHEMTLPPDSNSAHIEELEAGRLYDVILVAEKGSSQSEPATTQATPVGYPRRPHPNMRPFQNGTRPNLRPPQHPHRGPIRRPFPPRKLTEGEHEAKSHAQGIQTVQSGERDTTTVIQNGQSGGQDNTLRIQTSQLGEGAHAHATQTTQVGEEETITTDSDSDSDSDSDIHKWRVSTGKPQTLITTDSDSDSDSDSDIHKGRVSAGKPQTLITTDSDSDSDIHKGRVSAGKPQTLITTDSDSDADIHKGRVSASKPQTLITTDSDSDSDSDSDIHKRRVSAGKPHTLITTDSDSDSDSDSDIHKRRVSAGKPQTLITTDADSDSDSDSDIHRGRVSAIKPSDTREPLDYVGVRNLTSDGFTLVWDTPEGKYKNFVVTRKEQSGKDEQPKEKEEGRGREAEEENPKEDEEEGRKGTTDGKEVERGRMREENTVPEGDVTQTPGIHSSTTAKQAAGSENPFKKVIPGSARSFPFENLPPQTEFTVTLLGKGPGLLSRLHKLVISTGPEPPSNLVFSEMTEHSLTVSWTKPKSPIDSFKVTYTHTEEAEPVSVSVGSKHSTLGLSQLSPGSTYEISVISVLGLDESDPIKDFIKTHPDPPTDLRAINVTDTKALLLWRPALAAVDKYTIVYGTGKDSDLRITVSGNAAEQQLGGLEGSTTYTYTITSQLGSLESSPATTTFTTTNGSGGDGEGPRDLQASQVTPRTALLSWKPPSTAVGSYKLIYRTDGQEPKEVTVGATATQYKLSRLQPGSKYTVQLQGERGGHYSAAISAEFTTGTLRFPFPTDCSQELLNGIMESGEVEIFPRGKDGPPLMVYCDMETDGGGWMVFQRRKDGSVDFFRGWKDYIQGFGDLSGEFWLGLEKLHNLTTMTRMSLRVDLRAGDESVFAKYSTFEVAKKNYRLTVAGYSGTAGDSMTYHNNRLFSTKDRDPMPFITRCAMSYRGGWWYKNCHEANLNGLYGIDVKHQGVIWTSWKGKEFSIPFTEMKMRPAAFAPPARG